MEVNLDTKTAYVDIPADEGQLTICLSPLVNLFIHTLNLYDLLGGHGNQYTLRKNMQARKAIISNLYSQVTGKDRYFTHGDLDIYEASMQKIVEDNLYLEKVAPQLLDRISLEAFPSALANSWKRFYEDYWTGEFDRLLTIYQKMIEDIDWPQTIDQMAGLSQSSLHGEMLLFLVEATAESALTFGKNTCIGTLQAGSDGGFVHEGLHLLLDEKWADSPRLNTLIESKGFTDPFWKNWQNKYEQALVVSLDCHIRDFADDLNRVRKYFRGCRIEDLYPTVWPLVSRYVQERKGTIEELMYRVIAESLQTV